MSLLLSNDDGIHAPGLEALALALRPHHELMMIAPDRDRSGVSNSLTLDRPLQATRLDPTRIAVDGTPTDCIHLGTAGIFMPEPEQVLSGINYGANLGDDVLYSGTVAAAMEGRFLRKPAMALSLAVNDYGAPTLATFTQAAQVARYLLGVLQALDLPPRSVLNVNIPDLPASEIQGIRLTTLGQRLRGENPISTRNPRGKTLYWIGRVGGPIERTPGTDFHALAQGYVSVTPLHADMTSPAATARMTELFGALTANFDAAQLVAEGL
ncbi:MAG: 5'/3'-nucleotidase SurE [Pseudomonadales bacterium]|jgi:5'-nucleotidase|nr:5'/3'-nucleotidase SurE [Pseudomonadales bacterium]